ncbi:MULTISPECIES: hypothetical protein [Pectobacterium]|uniref:hypothetical protein n=1 Tax=Pectobacterium TaxID=122277 RepID=UPI00208A3B3A|nr:MULTISPECIES: hypothetical protein [Pectobacterium]GKV95298.1 hypothetical protein PEC301645_27450 [Pectobacterium carotovorum subsp. carotovorum]
MGQSVSFTPVPAGLGCNGIGYGATSSQVISGAVSATSSHRDSGKSCIHSFVSGAYVSAVMNGGVRHVA